MTKAELIAAIEAMPDDAEVLMEAFGQLLLIQVECHEGASGTFADGFIVVKPADHVAG